MKEYINCFIRIPEKEKIENYVDRLVAVGFGFFNNDKDKTLVEKFCSYGVITIDDNQRLCNVFVDGRIDVSWAEISYEKFQVDLKEKEIEYFKNLLNGYFVDFGSKEETEVVLAKTSNG